MSLVCPCDRPETCYVYSIDIKEIKSAIANENYYLCKLAFAMLLNSDFKGLCRDLAQGYAIFVHKKGINHVKKNRWYNIRYQGTVSGK